MLDCEEELRCIELEEDAENDYIPTVENQLVNEDRTKPVAYSRHMNMKESISDDRSATSQDSVISEVLQQQMRLIDVMSAPRAEIQVFDGDPLMYWPFVRAFEDNIEKAVKDSASRLTRLLQYCSGKARKVLQGCSVMPPQKGYERARALLKETVWRQSL